MNKIISILIMVVLLAITGCFTVRPFKILNGVIESEGFSMVTPTVGKFGSFTKDKESTSIDVFHFEREPETLIPSNPDAQPTP